MLLMKTPSLRLLFVAQALYWSCAMVAITLTALVGAQLTPLPALATLPLALLVLGNLIGVPILSVFMQEHGRRAGFLLGAASGIAGGGVAALGVWWGDFVTFCAGAMLIGGYQASAMLYRFAALEACDPAHKGRAAAWVLAGGVVAAVLGPTLSLWSKDALPVPFLGAYLLVAALASVAALVLLRLRETAAPAAARGGVAAYATLLGRPVVRAAIATTAVGHGTMILVMNATPLAMQFCALPVSDVATVIQWHVLGMFLPGFFAGHLVDRFGARAIGALGALVLIGSVGVAVASPAFSNFLVSSLLLGAGWNLMLVAGTTLLSDGHAPQERGHAQGLMELANGSVAALGSLGAGVLLAQTGWNAVNFGALPLLLLALVAVTRRRRPATADGI